MTMARWTIRKRLTVWYLAVLVPAMLLLAGGSWWLMRRSLLDAADSHLRARIEGAERLIRGMQHELSIIEIRDEFREFAELTMGDGPIEVTDGNGLVLCQPPMGGWAAVRAAVIVPPPEGSPATSDATLDGRPVRVVAASTRVDARTYRVVAASPMGRRLTPFGESVGFLGAFAPGVLLIAGLGGLDQPARAGTGRRDDTRRPGADGAQPRPAACLARRRRRAASPGGDVQ